MVDKKNYGNMTDEIVFLLFTVKYLSQKFLLRCKHEKIKQQKKEEKIY